jgi:hypothetical protein
MLYTVKYKRSDQWFWRKITRVKGDYIPKGIPAQIFIKEDESTVMVPFGAEIKVSPERFWSIKQKMEQESGQDIKVRTNAKQA